MILRAKSSKSKETGRKDPKISTQNFHHGIRQEPPRSNLLTGIGMFATSRFGNIPPAFRKLGDIIAHMIHVITISTAQLVIHDLIAKIIRKPDVFIPVIPLALRICIGINVAAIIRGTLIMIGPTETTATRIRCGPLELTPDQSNHGEGNQHQGFLHKGNERLLQASVKIVIHPNL